MDMAVMMRVITNSVLQFFVGINLEETMRDYLFYKTDDSKLCSLPLLGYCSYGCRGSSEIEYFCLYILYNRHVVESEEISRSRKGENC